MTEICRFWKDHDASLMNRNLSRDCGSEGMKNADTWQKSRENTKCKGPEWPWVFGNPRGVWWGEEKWRRGESLRWNKKGLGGLGEDVAFPLLSWRPEKVSEQRNDRLWLRMASVCTADCMYKIRSRQSRHPGERRKWFELRCYWRSWWKEFRFQKHCIGRKKPWYFLTG